MYIIDFSTSASCRPRLIKLFEPACQG